jgi:hypothetical protein
MVGDNVAQEIEPEEGKLREHTAFMRNARGEHVVERRDAVGGYEKQMFIVEMVDVPDLAAGVELEFREVSTKQNGVEKLGAHD